MRWDAFGCFSFFSVFSEVTLLSNSFKFAFLLKLQSAYLVPTVTLCGGAVVRCLFSEACLALPFYPGAEGGSQKNLPEGGATPFSKRGRLQPPPFSFGLSAAIRRNRLAAPKGQASLFFLAFHFPLQGTFTKSSSQVQWSQNATSGDLVTSATVSVAEVIQVP